MTEPNEPKIVHFPPRAQAPVQDTAGNWEPDEQLFGLEQLLQQLPPIRKLHLEKGKLTDLMRLYPDMKRTFDAPELLSEAVIASAWCAGAWSCCSSARTISARRAMRS